MTTSFPETKTGLRFGLASLAATACLAAILAASLPVRAQDNPVLAKVNGVEIRQSDGTTVVQKQEAIPGGTEKSYQYDALPAGTYTFICSIHPVPAMTGTLTVK